MEMEEDSLDPEDVERAKAFWKKEDIDDVFHVVFGYLGNLKRVLKKNTATDREYVQGLKLLEALNCSASGLNRDSSVVQVVIGSGELMVPEDSLSSPCSSPAAFSPNRDFSAAASPGDLLPPLTPVQLHYRPHTCSKACLTTVPIMPQSVPLFWGQNPLKIPLLCGFKRLTARLPLTEGAELEDSEDSLDGDVIYKTPCGLSLRNYDDVMSFLLDTESYDILQVDFFTYNPFIQLDPPPSDRHQLPELDLSRGIEPTPVELCLGEGGAKPPNFRYRKDRWPHGCFLSRSLKLFSTCCDCVDGCSDAKQCACVAMTKEGRHYSHQRLEEPISSGVYECGPWCGCDRARCQNRLVQRGIRVRLQVFQTDNCGWGVRCRDDLDRGTFVCTYAGVILQRAQSSITPPSPKLPRIELPSDDEVQVVTEWLVPSQEDGKSAVMEGSSPPLHVPVIQRPADAKTPQDRDKKGPPGGQQPAATLAAMSDEPTSDVCRSNGSEMEKKNMKSLKRVLTDVDTIIVDASKEGNVGRFFNHSCKPNLFLQNVFTDSHDLAFPVIAFFTSRVVKAGTELTWDYSTHVKRKQEVPCLCGSRDCTGHFAIEEKLCEMCEAEAQ
ncbi:hypothetical protein fugu_002244 [Takifugu bimaculatus]|uniref:Histone-lysine N-methyltransferase SETDB2 n=1 Tax=Takifugu bimaculatus TaxID=433685 RepID=A0A4Z2BQR4_9TELE|nr:hypothetical protein fugu_002244 [Takifugu bimaculatus]